MPKTGPRLGWRIATVAFFPITLSPCASPIVVVVFPSPSGVGVIAVTTTYLPRLPSFSIRSIASMEIFALVRPYGSTSSGVKPRSAATASIGFGVTLRAISRSDGKDMR